MAHLTELRRRLLYSVAALIVLFFLCYGLADPIFDILTRPLAQIWREETGKRLIYTALHEKFLTNVKLAFFAAAFLAFPVIAVQIWMFVAPGLYREEKTAFLPFLVATPILFLAGAAFVYFLVIPLAWEFFAGFEQAGGAGRMAIELEPKVNEYLALVMRLIFAFGVAFELPVALVLLVRTGIVEIDWLRRGRRYAILLAFVAAAILTPPDPLSQLGLALPLIALYELSIHIAAFWQRRAEGRGP